MPLARLCLCLLLAPWCSSAAALEYLIDPAHTYVYFALDHLGFSTQHGRFNQIDGRIEVDPETRSGHLDIRIAAASIDTGLALRDDILRGESWFNSRDFPYLLFRSDQLIFVDARLVAVEGTLAMLGVVRPMRLEISRFKCGFNLVLRQRGCGADAQAVLQRSDYGFTTGAPFIGDEVRLRIQVEAYPP